MSPSCTADTSKQSSRSPSTLPYIASRSPSSRSMYPEPLGHLQLPHRAAMQDSKSDRSVATQHHVRSDGHSGEDIGWKLYCTTSFTTALSMVMAELAKQVEVHCSERAHALALTFNLYSAAMDTCQGTNSHHPWLFCQRSARSLSCLGPTKRLNCTLTMSSWPQCSHYCHGQSAKAL